MTTMIATCSIEKKNIDVSSVSCLTLFLFGLWYIIIIILTSKVYHSSILLKYVIFNDIKLIYVRF